MSTLATNAITDAAGGNTATINSYTPTESNMAGRNRIINGDMRIDQRNAGASTSVSAGATFYGVDRFAGFFGASATGCTTQQASTAPAGFINSFKFAVGTGASSSSGQTAWIGQRIEGLNVADLGWGTANAKTVTLSFYVYASATGTYCVFLTNSAGDRSYVATYTISSANTWEQKTITIAGDTSGTWLTTSGLGVSVRWDLGSGSSYNTATTSAWQAGDYRNTSSQVNVIGTSSATFYITGVQLEAGSVTPFERRLYGQELALCQRYYWRMYSTGNRDMNGYAYSNALVLCQIYFPVTMRNSSLTLDTTGTASQYEIAYTNAKSTTSAVPSLNNSSAHLASVLFTPTGTPLTAGHGVTGGGNTTSAWFGFSAEL